MRGSEAPLPSLFLRCSVCFCFKWLTLRCRSFFDKKGMKKLNFSKYSSDKHTDVFAPWGKYINLRFRGVLVTTFFCRSERMQLVKSKMEKRASLRAVWNVGTFSSRSILKMEYICKVICLKLPPLPTASVKIQM